MLGITKFNPSQFGLQGRRLAIVELEKITGAMLCIFHHSGEEFISILKSRFGFSIIPVIVDSGEHAGSKMAVVDVECAERAFQYIRENAEPELLEALKAKHEFELKPLAMDKRSLAGTVAKCVRFVLGVGIMMVLVSALSGCAEAPAERVMVAESGHVKFDHWGSVKSVNPVRKTKGNDYQRVVTTKVIFSEFNVKSFPDGFVSVGDVIGQEVRITQYKATTRLCKNGRCVPYGVCYSLMPCFKKYDDVQ